jgi:hypothetical protein
MAQIDDVLGAVVERDAGKVAASTPKTRAV